MAGRPKKPESDDGPLPTDEAARSIMENLLARLTDRQLAKMQNPNVQRMFSPRQIQDAFLETFELVGGVPRLALWANDPKNYGDFVRLLIQLSPKALVNKGPEGGGKVIYQSAIPQSPLNRSAKSEAPKTDEDVTDV